MSDQFILPKFKTLRQLHVCGPALVVCRKSAGSLRGTTLDKPEVQLTAGSQSALPSFVGESSTLPRADCLSMLSCFSSHKYSASVSDCFAVSVVGTATCYELDDRGAGVRVSVGSVILTSPYRPDRLWDPPSLQSN
jgi:hypothetical protein